MRSVPPDESLRYDVTEAEVIHRDNLHLRIDKGYPGGAAHFGKCSYNSGSYIHVLYII